MALRTGTRIETISIWPGVAPETASICRWTKRNGAIRNHVSPDNGGWHVVKFDADGGSLLMHESRFRVIDNRA
jgi:hypothetical protein